MGNDGGSIPKRRELVKEAARLPTASELKATALESQAHAWSTCPISAAVSDARRDASSEEQQQQPSQEAAEFARSGIRSLKDVVKLRFCRDPHVPLSLKELGAAYAWSTWCRAAMAEALRQKRSLTKKPLKSKRDQEGFDKWAAVDHDASSLGYNLETPLDVIFDSNSTCALVPETTIGPYWVSGELIRTDITDGQAGVPLHLDIQFIDLNSCEPIPAETLIDIVSLP
ncbi:hypothetical protein NUW58_g8350 [Xylaria curta]|uniref:Uncharacterized protein n=1 Tax=Xylaria curta TaxID=42375 RepID=A0ACC1N9I8_9PEZI|nr:hypothetical protein NUW58_g8350 [Xylaria curta]